MSTDFFKGFNASVPATDTLGVVYLISSTLITVSNLIVVVVVARSPELHLPTMWNIAFMAVCDLIYGLSFFLFAVPSAFMKRFAYPDFMVDVGAVLFPLLIGQNMLNVMVATVDRYLFLVWPLRYPRLMTKMRFIIANSITFCINVVHVCLIGIPDFDGDYYPVLALPAAGISSTTAIVAVVGLTLTTTIVIVTVLILISVQLVRSRRHVHPVAQDINARSLSVAMALSGIIFCLCQLPALGLWVWIFSNGLNSVSPEMINIAVFCLVSMSFWNVILYGGVYKPFRNSFLRLFCPAYYRRKMQRKAIDDLALERRG